MVPFLKVRRGLVESGKLLLHVLDNVEGVCRNRRVPALASGVTMLPDPAPASMSPLPCQGRQCLLCLPHHGARCRGEERSFENDVETVAGFAGTALGLEAELPRPAL